MSARGSEGSQRLYSRDQVEQLRFIKSRLDSGASAAEGHRRISQALAGEHVPPTGAERGVESRPVILIAERDSYAAGLAEYFLRTEGYQVAIASDARQARLHFDERSPDAVIIDLLLSGGAGFRLCAEFAAKGTAQVLAISAIDSADEAMRSGAAAFLRKPLDPLVLVSTVRDLLATSALPPQRPPSHASLCSTASPPPPRAF